MATIVDNLLLKLGVTGAGQVKSARSEVSGLINAFGKLVGVSASIYTAVSAVSNFVNEAVKLDRVSKATGVAVESLSAWKQALDAAGEDGNAFLGTVEGITNSVNEMLVSGGGDIRTYLNQLGVDVFDANGKLKDATEIITDVADQWGNFSSREQTMIGQHLGIDEGTIRMMQRGGAEVRQLLADQKELGVITSAHAKSAQAVSTAYYGLKNTWRVVSYALSADLMPALEWALLKLNDASRWIANNKPIVYGFLIGLAALFAPVAAGWIIAFAPALAVITILTAIGTALYYLYDDFMVWRRGGIVAFGGVWEAGEKLVNGITAIFGKFGAFLKGFWNDPKKTWDETIEYFRNRWKGMSLVEIGKDIIRSFSAAVKTAWNEYVFPFFEAIDNKFKQWFGFSLIEEGGKIIESLEEGIKNGWTKLKAWWANTSLIDEGKSLALSLWNGLDNGWGKWVVPFAQEADKQFKGWFGFSLLDEGAAVIDSFITGVKDSFAKLEQFFVTYDFKGLGKRIGNAITDAVVKAWDWAGAVDRSDWGEVGESIKNGLARALSFGVNVIFAIADTVRGVVDAIASRIWESLKEKIAEKFPTLSGVLGTASDAVGAAYDTVSGWVGGGKKADSIPPAVAEPVAVPSATPAETPFRAPRYDAPAIAPTAPLPQPQPMFVAPPEPRPGIFDRVGSAIDAMGSTVASAVDGLGMMILPAIDAMGSVSPMVSLSGDGGTSYHMSASTSIQNLNVTAQGNSPRQHATAVSNFLVGQESRQLMSMSGENGIRR